jgi:hypothetical protein
MVYNKVTKWRNNLDSIQSVDHHDSESPLTILRFETDSPLQQLVGPNDSASNISEVVSESNLQKVESTSNVNSRIYDMNDPEVLADLMNDPTVFPYLDTADKNYYFHVLDNIYVVYLSVINLII